MHSRDAEAVRLFEVDPDLLCRVSAADAKALEREAIAPVVRVGRGPWCPVRGTGGEGAPIYFVLDGYLLFSVTCAGKRGAEIFGPGDVVDAAGRHDVTSPIRLARSWVALTPVRLA